MSGKVIVHAIIYAKPEHIDEVKQAMIELRDFANEKEPGTLVYRVSVNKEDKNKLEVFEEYASQKAAQDHLAGAPFKSLASKGKEWFSAPPVISFSEELGQGAGEGTASRL